MPTIRVAAAQFESGEDTDANLAEMLTLAMQAADAGAELVHFPEFCNHPTWYASRDHAWQAATAPDSSFVRAIGDLARRRQIYISFNATARGAYPDVYGQNHLIGRAGELLVANRKQILMYHEKDHLQPSDQPGRVAHTEIGNIGLMSCMDGLVPETVRCLVVDGADLILNSLSSNGLDEAHTHIPARAAENGVFVVSANRVGLPIDGKQMPALEEMTGMTRERLMGAGESQIVGPDGAILARASRTGTEVVIADIDLSKAQREERLARRRPRLYAPLSSSGALTVGPPLDGPVSIAAVTPSTLGVGAALLACSAVDAQLVVLPELCVSRRSSAPSQLAAEGEELVGELTRLCHRQQRWVIAGIAHRDGDRYANAAVVVGPSGLIATYRQIHVHSDDQAWARPGDQFVTVDLPFGRVGLLVGQDLALPEPARVLARLGADLLACPMTWRAEWEASLSAVERCAENHVAVAVAARGDSPCSLPNAIITVPAGYPFPRTGEVNSPDRRCGSPAVSLVDLRSTRDKLLMGRTDLIRDARPELYGALTR